MDFTLPLREHICACVEWCKRVCDTREVLVFAVALLGSGYVMRTWRRAPLRAPLPPGPPTYPLLGNIDIYADNPALYEFVFEVKRAHSGNVDCVIWSACVECSLLSYNLILHMSLCTFDVVLLSDISVV